VAASGAANSAITWTNALTIASTGAATFSATDATGNRTNPFNTLTIITDNPTFPYERFGGSILFNNRSYTHGIVSTSRIRSVIYDGGGSEGGGLTFETTPTAGGTLTPTMTLYYNGNVGINNEVPTYKLDVNGTGRFTAPSGTQENITVKSANTGFSKIVIDALTSASSQLAFLENGTQKGVVGYRPSTGNVFLANATGDILTIASTGAATFSSSVTATGFYSTTGSNFATSSGRVGVGTTNPADKFVVSNSGAEGIEFGFDAGVPYLFGYNRSTSAYKPIAFVGSGNVIITQGTIVDNGSKLQVTGAATFSSSVTATSFFESSDSRLKTLIQDNYQTKGIASITPKLYTKNGKVELGYYAQDFVGILDSAISKGSDDMLSLSYREVLVAKVYALEQEIKELKAKMN
jgi:hypothetical protein